MFLLEGEVKMTVKELLYLFDEWADTRIISFQSIIDESDDPQEIIQWEAMKFATIIAKVNLHRKAGE